MGYYHNFTYGSSSPFELKESPIGYNELNPNDNFAFYGKHMAIPGGVQTANQLQELSNSLNQGVVNVELGPLQPDILEQIPKQHFGEAYRLAKLSGAKISMHGPIMDLGGFGQQGYSDAQREYAENQFKSILERAHDFDPTGNVPVVFHTTAGTPAFELRKGHTIPGLTEEQRKQLKFPEDAYTGVAINQITGQIAPLQYEERYKFGADKEHKDIFHPTVRLENLNESEWDNEQLRVQTYLEDMRRIQERMQGIAQQAEHLEYGKHHGVLNDEEQRRLVSYRRDLDVLQGHIKNLSQLSRSQLGDMWTKVEKYADADAKKKFFEEEHTKKLFPDAKEKWEQLQKAIKTYEAVEDNQRITKERKEELAKDIGLRSEEYNKQVITAMAHMPTPQVYRPVNDFAKEKVSDTVASAVFYAYNQFKENAPLVALENYYPDLVLGNAEGLRDVVLESRKKFENKLIKDRGISEKEAQRISAKLIGATWDTGHINTLRKSGYSHEDVLKEAETIAKSGVVKHVHINDTFGFTDSHLPPGMGNAGVNEQLALLEKWDKNELRRAVVEAGAFVAQFKQSPHLFGLESLNTPIYQQLFDVKGALMPFNPGVDLTWRGSTDIYDNYGSGFGNILPELHFRDFYGGGFANLPNELGGQIGGDKSRFAGTPNQ
ncbi:hypothetical protein J4455_00520 [Candidatus Woesearchaeota archaeon]|nr:hypothetical protein [Candidatus Woesearchaeota archaeon]